MSSRPSNPPRRSAKGEYIETDSGNKVSRRANISGTANITLGGRTVIMAEVHLRGDLQRLSSSSSGGSKGDGHSSSHTPTAISIGRCTVISTGSVIKPPSRISRGVLSYYPVKIGDNVFIGAHCHISAASISSHVHIGEHSQLHPFCIIKENVKILPYSIVPAHTVIPSFSVVGGRPARVIGEVGEGWGEGGSKSGTGEGWVEGGELRELVRSIR